MIIVTPYLGQDQPVKAKESRESILQTLYGRALSAMKSLTGLGPPYHVPAEYFAAIVNDFAKFANEKSAFLALGYKYTEREVETGLRKAGYLPEDGQGSRADIVQDAVDHALTVSGMTVDPRYSITITTDKLKEITNIGRKYALEAGKPFGYMMGFVEVKNAILARGYNAVDPSKMTVIPDIPLRQETARLPIKATSQYQPPARYVPVPEPLPVIQESPLPVIQEQRSDLVPYLPVAPIVQEDRPALSLPPVLPEMIPEPKKADKTLLIAAGLAALLLAL